MENSLPKPLQERQIAIANELARAIVRLGLQEQRLICLALTKTHQRDPSAIGDPTRRRLTLSAADWHEVYGTAINKAYGTMRDAASTLLRSTITRLIEGKKAVLEYQWLSRGKYIEGQGIVQIEWHEDVVPLLFTLSGEFLMFRLRHAAQLNSINAWKLFFLLGTWNGAGHWKIDLADFHNAIDSAEGYRKQFKRFREDVIEPALTQLRATGAFKKLRVEYIKSGRNITSLHFHFDYNRWHDQEHRPSSATLPPKLSQTDHQP